METEVVKWSLDPNWILAVITFAAILSPIATAIINNLHQTKMKKLDMYEETKRRTLENFIQDATLYVFDRITHIDDKIKYQNLKLLQNYKNSLNALYLYFDMPDTESFKNQLYSIEAANYSSDSYINEVTMLLAKQIKKK